MNDYQISVLFGYSILVAAIIGLVRYRKCLPAYLPFFIFVWMALLNHFISMIAIGLTKGNAINGNMYVLAEALVLLWLFKRWGAFYKKDTSFFILLFFLISCWVADNFVLNKITTINSPYRIVYSFTLIFLSISQINKVIGEERQTLIRNAQFLICMAIIINFTYKTVVEVFFLIQLPASMAFYRHIFLIFVYINLLVNIIFAIAAAWIPTKQKFILRY